MRGRFTPQSCPADRSHRGSAVERHQLLAKLIQYPGHNWIDPAQQMARWDTPFEIEKVKQPALIAALPTHHDPTSSLKPSTKRNHDSTIISTTFSTLSVINRLMRRNMIGA
jgi:hypothetical protein